MECVKNAGVDDIMRGDWQRRVAARIVTGHIGEL